MGVGDGVGGWHGQDNANASLYARKIMHYSSVELERAGTDNGQLAAVDPVDILQRAYDRTSKDAAALGFVGSTTACVVVLANDELRIANLGDCGVAIVRQGEYVFRTEEQVHSFNYPYQLGTTAQDLPGDSQRFHVRAQHGDIVVIASDGVWDNLFDEDLLGIVRAQIDWDPQPLDALGAMFGDGFERPSAATVSSGTLGSAFAGALSWASSALLAKSGLGGESGAIPPLTSSASSEPEPPSSTTTAAAGTPLPPSPSSPPEGDGGVGVGATPTLQPCTADVAPAGPARTWTGGEAVTEMQLAAAAIPLVSRARRAAVHASARANPQTIADAIASRAKEASEDPRGASPFQSRALREGLYYQGGKVDDISVVVGVVRDPTRVIRGQLRAVASAGRGAAAGGGGRG
ncbi:hypothetical protein H9P43_006362 [Blastocladiella emersonii ATCC 22665]|nr:hypothetical protein H9P43_006362 [Blastocladiella emersonii ATCC 22665]